MKKTVIKIKSTAGDTCYLSGVLRWPEDRRLFIDFTDHPEDALPLDAFNSEDEQANILRDIKHMQGVAGVSIDIVEVFHDV